MSLITTLQTDKYFQNNSLTFNDFQIYLAYNKESTNRFYLALAD
jgi:hypothetical protein